MVRKISRVGSTLCIGKDWFSISKSCKSAIITRLSVLENTK